MNITKPQTKSPFRFSSPSVPDRGLSDYERGSCMKLTYPMPLTHACPIAKQLPHHKLKSGQRVIRHPHNPNTKVIDSSPQINKAINMHFNQLKCMKHAFLLTHLMDSELIHLTITLHVSCNPHILHWTLNHWNIVSISSFSFNWNNHSISSSKPSEHG